MKILFAVDGSDFTVRAAEYLAHHFHSFRDPPELHLIYVKLPIPSGLALVQANRILGREAVDQYYKEEAQAALRHAENVLRKHHIPFQSIYRVGDIAHEICDYAGTNQADLIVMGSHGHGAIGNLLLGSVATKVLALAHDIPVLIVR